MMSHKKSIGLYVHIPFCLKKCNYCDFCSVAGSDEDTRERYVNRLCEDLARRAEDAALAYFDSVYFGGGTPTVLTAEQICRVLDTVRRCYHLLPDTEITIECNPATASVEKLSALRQGGCNRLSIGAQSFVDGELALLGRAHRSREIVETVEDAVRAGFERLSLDLMYGIPDQTAQTLMDSLQGAMSLGVEHLSVYSLIVEEGTPFARERHRLSLPTEDQLCEMTDIVTATLADAGYRRYEISNYAKDGRVSRHNMHYWRLDDYLGFGPSAHSLWRGVRWGQSCDLAAYLSGQDITEPEEILSPESAMDEYVMLGLRLAAGVDKCEFLRRFGRSFDEIYGRRVAPFVQSGHFVDTTECIHFHDRGLEVSNYILSEILFE
jgi:oxygen-independent coproporphyrinogen-3 oxidase